MELWPHIGLVQAYGQTELAPIATMLSPDDHRAGGQILKSAGRPTPINDVRVVSDEGDDCPVGESGEVVVRGPHTMMGYWNKPAETEKALKDGWVYTGDAGLFDENGYLYIVDRLKDMVVTGGENVFTTEVENALISHDAVQDVSVIGIPHEEWGRPSMRLSYFMQAPLPARTSLSHTAARALPATKFRKGLPSGMSPCRFLARERYLRRSSVNLSGKD